MRLLHYTSKPLHAVHSVEQPAKVGSRYDKPRGLWVSVEGEDDWATWCRAEQFGDVDAQMCYEIVLADDARILRLSSALDLHEFTHQHGFNPYPDSNLFSRGHAIRWADVACEYQGIIIAPYIWGCRLNNATSWYYSWDCASGCIWDADAIARVVELAGAERAGSEG